MCVCVCVSAFWEEGEVGRKKTSLIILLFLSMLSHSMVLRRVGMENALKSDTHARAHTYIHKHILHKHRKP